MKQLTDNYIGDQLSNATMRTEDLIPSFMNYLHHIKEECGVTKEVNELQEEVNSLELEEKDGYGEYYKNPKGAGWLLNEDIWNLLQNIAPNFTYFGSHEGDGAAYGFWTSEDALRDHIQTELTPIADDDYLDFEEVKNALSDLVKLLEAHNR